LVVDSTGVKVYGEGEWKVRQHEWSKRRTWLKLHVCGDESSFETIGACATTNNVNDGEVFPDLINDVSGPKTRKVDNQFKELLVKCAVLNRMTHLGTPESYKI
jgi:hypothetical protein